MEISDWVESDLGRTWQALTGKLDAIVAAEQAGGQVPAQVWWDADRDAFDLGLDLRGQLELLRGPGDSPDGKHSPFLGSRCQYCNGNFEDLSVYTLDPDACPPEWGCGADHPDRDDPSLPRDAVQRYAYCRLRPEHDAEHAYAYSPRTNDAGNKPEDRPVVTLTWTGRSRRQIVGGAYGQAHDVVRDAGGVDSAELRARVSAIFEAAELSTDAGEFVAEWVVPRRPIAAAGIVLHVRDGALVPALVGGPEVAVVLAVVADHVALDATEPGAAFEAAAASTGLDPYEIHLVYEYAASGLAPCDFGVLPNVFDCWGQAGR